MDSRDHAGALGAAYEAQHAAWENVDFHPPDYDPPDYEPADYDPPDFDPPDYE